MDERDDKAAGGEQGGTGHTRLQLGLRLQPVDHSDQPVFANFTMVQGAPSVVFLDFGFLEPAVLPSLARLAKSGGKAPETVNGRLACRVALGADVAAQLAQQLNEYLAHVQPKSRPAKAAN